MLSRNPANIKVCDAPKIRSSYEKAEREFTLYDGDSAVISTIKKSVSSMWTTLPVKYGN